MGAQAKIEQVKTWIWDKYDGSDIDALEIGWHTDLIDNRIIDSLQFVEFLLFLEQLTGTEIYTSDFTLDRVRTLAKIEETYFHANAESASL